MFANILLLLLILVYFASLHKLFQKAGRPGWEGFVPFYNLYVWLRIMKKPWWWMLLMVIPGVNFLMVFVLNVELARSFGKRSIGDALQAILLPWYYVPYLAYSPDIHYTGPIDFKKHKKTITREWFDALLFAVIAATIIRTFFLEAFKIPTPSMEKNLLTGDFLFVSKMSYGAKLPNTPISFPFTHNTLPVFNTRSYLEIFTLPYLRLPGFGKVQRNDVVVFNFPAGDSVLANLQDRTYYAVVRDEAYRLYIQQTGDRDIYAFDRQKEKYMALFRNSQLSRDNVLMRPIDKKDNYIKRCVALPGDEIYIRNRQLYVNGEPSGNTPEMQFNYYVQMDTDKMLTREMLKTRFDINRTEHSLESFGSKAYLRAPMTDQVAEQFRSIYGNAQVREEDKDTGYYHLYASYDGQGNPSSHIQFMPVFPNDIRYNWTEDNFGPLRIPAEGETVSLTLENLPLYQRVIEVYEGNKLEVKDSLIYLNGQAADRYTFRMNYYWLMGDNRQNSADSRFWGFVPEDHVVGKAVMVWFSTDAETGIRWNRIFKVIR